MSSYETASKLGDLFLNRQVHKSIVFATNDF